MPPDKLLSTFLGGVKRMSPADRRLGIQVLVRNQLHVGVTAEELGVSYDTVKAWKRNHRDEIQEVQREMGPELEAQAVAGFQSFVVRAEAAKAKALNRVIDDLDADAAAWAAYGKAVAAGEDVEPPKPRVRDPAKALQAVSISQGIGVQKVLELTGRPTQIVETRSLTEAMARLRELGGEVIEGTVVEPAMLALPTAPAPTAGLPSEATEHGHRDDHQDDAVG